MKANTVTTPLSLTHIVIWCCHQIVNPDHQQHRQQRQQGATSQ